MTYYWGQNICLHCGFRQEDFFYFLPYISICKTCENVQASLPAGLTKANWDDLWLLYLFENTEGDYLLFIYLNKI